MVEGGNMTTGVFLQENSIHRMPNAPSTSTLAAVRTITIMFKVKKTFKIIHSVPRRGMFL